MQDDVNSELEKLRLELRHIKGVCKLVQDESINASQHVSLGVLCFNIISWLLYLH